MMINDMDGEMILSSHMNYVRHIVITKQLHIGLESAGRNSQIYTRQDGTLVQYILLQHFFFHQSGAAILLQYVTSSAMNGQMLGSIRNTTMKHPSMNCLAHSPR